MFKIIHKNIYNYYSLLSLLTVTLPAIFFASTIRAALREKDDVCIYVQTKVTAL